jgi:ribosome-associated protein
MQQEIISKSQRKREMHELQALGAALVELSEAQLRDFALDPGLHTAVLEAKRIRSHEARRRQLQYIGRLMRDIDAEPIRARLAALEGHSAESAARHRRLEAWRERLIADDEALTAFIAEHPGAEAQEMRTLIRNVRREAKEGKPPRSYRELFRLIKKCSG